MCTSTAKIFAFWLRKTRRRKTATRLTLFPRLQEETGRCAARLQARGASIMATPIYTPAKVNVAEKLSNEEILRYSRHLIMPEVGMEGQLKLKAAKVLLIGTGGLGAPLGLYLAA